MTVRPTLLWLKGVLRPSLFFLQKCKPNIIQIVTGIDVIIENF